MIIDLHTHTTASDGTYRPARLVEYAARLGLQGLGIADHDTIDGLAEALAAGQKVGLEIVPGVEFSIRYEPDKGFVGIHLLGYFINHQSPALIETIQKVRQGRVEQKIRQIEKLQSFGFDIPVEAVLERAAGVPGRPHIAAVLMERNPGHFESTQQVFDEYLGAGRKAHVQRAFALTLEQAAEVIKQAGGVPVLAHPVHYADPLRVIRNAQAEGIEGVEVFYAYQMEAEARTAWINRIESLADELGLLKTGGSDFHGRAGEEIEPGEGGLTRRQYLAFKRGWQQLRNQT